MPDYDVTPPPERLAGRVRLRTAFTTSRGDVTAFLVQLEYLMATGWEIIVRCDHDSAVDFGHDVTEDGLHRDVYRAGQKCLVEQVTGPIPATDGFNFAEEDLRDNVERYIKRFEQWHGISERTDL